MENKDIYWEPARNASVEFKEKRSLFIGHVCVARNEEEARAFVREISKKYSDATHNCWAYRVGSERVVEYYSDAGEPSGTAGKPILGAIQHAGVTNAIVVVTRYFGGIKLGVRGLMEAYGKGAAMALEEAGKVARRVSLNAKVVLGYEHTRNFIAQLKDMDVHENLIDATYEANVTLRFPVAKSYVAQAEELFKGYEARGLIISWAWES